MIALYTLPVVDILRIHTQDWLSFVVDFRRHGVDSSYIPRRRQQIYIEVYMRHASDAIVNKHCGAGKLANEAAIEKNKPIVTRRMDVKFRLREIAERSLGNEQKKENDEKYVIKAPFLAIRRRLEEEKSRKYLNIYIYAIWRMQKHGQYKCSGKSAKQHRTNNLLCTVLKLTQTVTTSHNV